MAVLAVLIPVIMLGALLALGRYEEVLLPWTAPPPEPSETAAAPSSATP
ncbi:hypothetical protein ACGFZL_17640 [Streptomyces sp. NPDC048182]